MKRRRLAEEVARVGTDLLITAYGTPLSPVTSFNYLGIFLSAADNDWPSVVNNLWRAWQKWMHLTRVLSREGAYVRTLGQV